MAAVKQIFVAELAVEDFQSTTVVLCSKCQTRTGRWGTNTTVFCGRPALQVPLISWVIEWLRTLLSMDIKNIHSRPSNCCKHAHLNKNNSFQTSMDIYLEPAQLYFRETLLGPGSLLYREQLLVCKSKEFDTLGSRLSFPFPRHSLGLTEEKVMPHFAGLSANFLFIYFLFLFFSPSTATCEMIWWSCHAFSSLQFVSLLYEQVYLGCNYLPPRTSSGRVAYSSHGNNAK